MNFSQLIPLFLQMWQQRQSPMMQMGNRIGQSFMGRFMGQPRLQPTYQLPPQPQVPLGGQMPWQQANDPGLNIFRPLTDPNNPINDPSLNTVHPIRGSWF